MKKLSLIFCLLPCLLSCQSNPKLIKKQHRQYGIGQINETWRQKNFSGADLFFEHQNKNAAIFFSSQCDNISDSPLEALTSQILVGLTNINVKTQNKIDLAGREALLSEIEAKMDGVPRFLKIMVLKKNGCVFDGVFSSSLANKELKQDFDALITDFWAEADL